MLDHRDDIYERFVIANLMRLLQIVHREPFRRCAQLLTQFAECLSAPSLRTVKQNFNGLNLRGIFLNETTERSKIIFGLVLFTVEAAHQPVGTDLILSFVS